MKRPAATAFAIGLTLLLTLLASTALAQRTSDAVVDLKQITAGEHTKLYPNISADGHNLVYMATKGGSRAFDVYTIDLRTNHAPEVRTRDKASAENPRWAGTEGDIVFDSDRIEKMRYVWLRQVTGAGGVLQLSTGGSQDFQADVSRDGKHLIYCSLADKRPPKSPRSGEDRIQLFKREKDLPEILIRTIGEPSVTTLTRGVNPAWSPDGERIAYASNITGNYEIYVVNADGTNPQQVTAFDGPDVEPAWSPDGKYLAFTREQNKNWNVWMVEIATGRQTQLTIHEKFDGGPTWAKDGTIYFHSDRAGNWDIWSMKPAGYSPEPETPPVVDADGDGYLDDVDQCVGDPEDFDGYSDEDGCPDPDNDNDGVPDVKDACPNVRETINGFKDADGCPDESPIKEKMVLFGVMFKSGSADLTEQSLPYLDAFADLMKEDRGAIVEIRGYTDNQGSEARNLDLSQKRADAVKNYLTLKGIDEARMKALGYGEADPIGDNKSPEGRALNRRIEVHRVN